MATIINTPAPVQSDSGNDGTGFVLGIILLLAFFFFAIMYLIPAIRSGFGGTAINVPDHVNVNIQEGSKK